jgi:putative flavoprotein involved in K+ transport
MGGSDCKAVVVGAGNAGLGAAALLGRCGLKVEVLERGAGAGAAWRNRYDALRLNSLGRWSGPPGHPISRSYGPYPTRDQWVGHLERYAARQRLQLRSGVEVERIERGRQCWQVLTGAGDYEAQYVVIATGIDALPDLPQWPGGEHFTGRLVHAANFKDAEPYVGQDVLVVGCGNSGSEIAHLLVRSGAARVRIAVRTPPNIFPRFVLGRPLYPASVLLEKLPTRLADSLGRLTQRLLYGDLAPYGLPHPPLGAKSTIAQKGIGPTIEDGFVAAVKAGEIEIVPALERFDHDCVVLADGSRLQPDTVIAATGYRMDLERLVGHLVELDSFGHPLVDRTQSVPEAPGLFFTGYWSGICGPLRRMRFEAKRIASAVERSQAASGRSFRFRSAHSAAELTPSAGRGG